MARFRIKPGSLRVDIPALTVRMSAEVDTVPADPIGDLPVTNTVDWASFIHRYVHIKKPDGRIARAFNTIVTNNGDDIVPLSGVRNGDPGLEGREERILIEAGDDVIVYNQRVPNTGWSRISGTDFLKKWDVEFDVADPQTEFPAPVPNCGTDQAATVDPITGVARLTFTVNPKYWSGSGEILWNLPDTGATLVAGYALTDLTIEVDFDPGQYEMTVVVTDTGFANEPLTRGFRNVFIKGEGFSPFSEVANIVAIEGDTTDRLGRSLTLVVQVDKDTDLSDYLYVGATVLLTYQVQELIAGVWTNQTDSITTFKGYLAKIDPGRRVGGVVTYRLLVENPLLYFRRFGIASQLLQAVDPPATWLEVHPDFAHLAFVLYYILEYNAPSLIQYVDLDLGDFESYTFPEFSFRSDTLTGTALSVAEFRTIANVGCKSDGTIVLRDHMNILDSTGRTALGSRYTWTARKIKGEITYERNPIPRFNRMLGYCFLIDGVTIGAFQANLLAPGFGSDDGTMPDFLALTLTEAAWIVARYLAFMSRPTETVGWEVQGMIDVTDPAEMKPHTMDTAAYDPLDCGIYENRVLPLSVSRTWKMTRNVSGREIFDPRFDVSITAEPETDAPAEAPEYEDPELGDVEGWDWAYYFDFTAGEAGFEAADSGPTIYVAGQGWRSAPSTEGDGTKQRLLIQSVEGVDGQLTYTRYCFKRDDTDTIVGDSQSIDLSTDGLSTSFDVPDAEGYHSKDWSGTASCAGRKPSYRAVYQPTTTTTTMKGAYFAGNGPKSDWFTTYGTPVSSIPECG